jgi:hypothetical protein
MDEVVLASLLKKAWRRVKNTDIKAVFAAWCKLKRMI